MTEIEFNSLVSQGYNRIPLISETYADLDTPLSLYLKLAYSNNSSGKMSCLLESVMGGDRFGRYSFIGLPAETILRSIGKITEVITNGKILETHEGNPLDFVKEYQDRFRAAPLPGVLRFCGGLAGYFAYDVVRNIEPCLGAAVKPFPEGMEEGTPDIMLLHIDELAVVDNLAGRIYLIVYADPNKPESYSKTQKRLAELKTRLKKPIETPYSHNSMQTNEKRNFTKKDYISAVIKAKEYIEAGDLMQVVIGQTITKSFRDNPLSLYRSLRSINPSPYMYFWNFDDFQVVGSSPEILVRQEKIITNGIKKSQITIRPLAGTRKRGGTHEQDLELEKSLKSDTKEIAEHVMLIDLARNDIGRVSEIGTVKVTDTMTIERYSHVMHLVSNVTGILKSNMGNMDVLKAAFPAGTLTGAPKIRAMEVIDELEPVRRGVYGGAAGYISYNGEMDVAIAIRTGIIKNGILYVQSAAGIVADSDPELEWAETEAKARAILRAAEQVQNGLD
ncbi:anthranilate synthase component I [Candidatus Kinetoplastibacterium oncopeltii TCC290E]|uniref:Anthranilate synthase component 1 n=1 Tax=Candidatus Kinetoplastidibacterium stringomonadis TCC290E TaxID=1208920 RepID=M1LR60_9PROT|nr:anthranilate synthase component I family protein [Candidatus Kinetoplastibacterium oncopeltii]AGF48072.1 anthranilate synthase component I [Candidatus Kinetoplastibacterium oncopeltii TCC290E]